MKSYSLFSEFCDSTIYGETLVDALRRAKTLPTPPRYSNRQPVEGSGGMVKIGAILGVEDVTNNNRGGKKFEAVVAEIDGRPCRVDAVPGSNIAPVDA